MTVPFVDLNRQYKNLKTEIDARIQGVLDSGQFIGGKTVDRFEAHYAQAYGVDHFLGVANGTDALFIALKVLGVGAGDEVITTASSWISTSETISLCGAKPVFVDVDPDTLLIDVDQIEAKITSKTKAIIPVHLYGQMADMEAVKQVADKHKLKVIEDCAQAHFASQNGQLAGTFGDVATFSFYPGKNLGAYGDAGGLTARDAAVFEKCKRFARHGALQKHDHEIEGINSRLDAMQAAILDVKLTHLPAWTKTRQAIANRYLKELSGVTALQLPKTIEGNSHVYHLFVVQVEEREALQQYLKDNGVLTGIHYPESLPLLPAYRYLGYKENDVPHSAKAHRRVLSLPMFPELREDEQTKVIALIKSYYA